MLSVTIIFTFLIIIIIIILSRSEDDRVGVKHYVGLLAVLVHSAAPFVRIEGSTYIVVNS